MGDEANAGDLLQESFSEYTECNARCSLAGTRAFKNRARLGQVVGQHARKIRVTGTRPRQRSVSSDLTLVARSSVDQQGGRIHRIRAHHRLPLGPLGITDADGNRGAGGHAVTDAGQD